MRRLLGAAPATPFPADDVAAIRVGTTVATNALLERTGAKTLFVTTTGFADALVIGNQTRPDLFALDIEKPAPLYAAVVEASERLGADAALAGHFHGVGGSVVPRRGGVVLRQRKQAGVRGEGTLLTA